MQYFKEGQRVEHVTSGRSGTVTIGTMLVPNEPPDGCSPVEWYRTLEDIHPVGHHFSTYVTWDGEDRPEPIMSGQIRRIDQG